MTRRVKGCCALAEENERDIRSWDMDIATRIIMRNVGYFVKPQHDTTQSTHLYITLSHDNDNDVMWVRWSCARSIYR